MHRHALVWIIGDRDLHFLIVGHGDNIGVFLNPEKCVILLHVVYTPVFTDFHGHVAFKLMDNPPVTDVMKGIQAETVAGKRRAAVRLVVCNVMVQYTKSFVNVCQHCIIV